jgi:cystathionine gamma-lyase
MDFGNLGFETKVIHAGVDPDPATGAVMTPIYQTSTYAQASPGEHRGYEYSRTDNPTRTVLQTQLAALESAERALVFASGLAAIDSVLNLLSSGDHVVAGDDLYGGTYRLFTKVAANRGLEFTFVNLGDEARLREAIRPNTRLIWFETPTNPMMSLVDLSMVGRVAREVGAMSCVDNTFMSPFFQRPLEHGVDLVMHSMTKYLNGHSDVVMGALMMNDRPWPLIRGQAAGGGVSGPGSEAAAGGDAGGEGGLGSKGESVYSRLKFLQNAIGAVPGPFDCFLVLRGLKTLAVRMQRHGENAMRVAQFLEEHPAIERVIYPGLASHPQHDLAKRQTDGFGGMLTFTLRGGLEEARSFLSKVRLFTLAESLGGVESLIEHPAIMTHASIPPEVRREIGIADNLVRVSVGIERVEDLIADLDQALK